MRNALIVGVDSLIGKELSKLLTQCGWRIYATSRQKSENTLYLDLSETQDFKFSKPLDVVFICAAITKINDCKQDPILSNIVNVDAPLALAKYFSAKDTLVVYLSSNAVFNGTKPKYKITDKTNPSTLYGQQKAHVEKALLKLNAKVAIVRLTKVLTPNFSLISQWISCLKHEKNVTAYSNVYISPISVFEVVKILKKIAERQLTGMFHLSGDEDVSYYELATCIAKLTQTNPALIEPLAMLESNSLESKITYASLDMSETRQQLDVPIMSYTAMLQQTIIK